MLPPRGGLGRYMLNSVRRIRAAQRRCSRHQRRCLFGGDRERRPATPGPYQAQRLRRLPQRPAAGAGREREREPDRRPSGQLPAAPARLRKLPPAHQRPPAEDVQEPDVRDAGAERRADPHLLQGRQLRNLAGQRRAHLQPAWRRDDPARHVRRSPHLRRHPQGSDVRGRLRRRRGPPVLHRRAPPCRPRPALLLRRRLQRRHGRVDLGRHALQRVGAPAPVRPRRRALRGARA